MTRDHMAFMSGNTTEGRRYRFFSTVSTRSRRFRWPIIIITIGITLFCLWRITTIRTDNSMESYFMENDPALADYHSYLDTFTADQFAYILIEHGAAIDRNDFKLVDSLTAKLAEKLPYVDDPDTDISSVSHVNYIHGTGTTIELYKPRERAPKTPEKMKQLRQSLLNRPLYRNRLLSSDATLSGITVNFSTPRTDKDRNWQTVVTEKLLRILDTPPWDTMKTHVVGQPVFNTVYSDLTRRETLRNSFFTAAALFLLLLLFLRSAHGVIFPVGVVSLSLIWVFGIMSYLTDMNITISIVPPLILAIGTCAVIHVLIEFRTVRHEFDTTATAVDHTIGMVGFPIFLASLTTAIGFLSLATAPIRPVRDTGILAASGTMITFLLTITLLPALISFLSAANTEHAVGKQSKFKAFCDRALAGIGSFDHHNPRSIITGFALLAIIAAIGLFFLRAETNWIEKIGDRFTIKQDYLFVDRNMGGSSSFELLFTLPENTGDFKSPDNLKHIRDLQTWLSLRKNVRDTMSLSDMVRELHMAFFEDNADYYRIPDTRQKIAQLLLLYESAGSRDLPRFVTDDYRSLRVNVRTVNMADEHMQDLFREIRGQVSDTMPKNWEMTITGTSRLSVQTMTYIVSSQITGFGLAFLVISIMMILLFRSLRVGLISMIPNLLPILFTLGFMGYADIPLDTTVMLIASIAIGIAVDDTIHLFTRYRMEFARTGNYRSALRHTIHGIGPALLFTSVILTTGYLVVSGSDMKNIAVFGLLSGITVILAWAADMFLAPAIILLLRPFGPEKK